MTLLSPRFAIQLIELDARSVRVGVEGDIDLLSAHAFRRVLLSQILAGRDVTLDLSRTEFMDSSGIKVMIEGIERSQARGTRLRVEPEPPHQIRRLFDITGVAEVLRRHQPDLVTQPR